MRLSNYFLVLLLFTNHCTIYEVEDHCKIEEYYNDGDYGAKRICYR